MGKDGIKTGLEEEIQQIGEQPATGRTEAKFDSRMDVAVDFNAHWRFAGAPQKVCYIFGKTEEEIKGKDFLSFIHPRDQRQVSNAGRNLYRSPNVCYVECRTMTRWGWRWYGWANRAMLNDEGRVSHIVAAGRDITERKRTEVSLRESEEKHRLLVENTSEAVIVFNPSSDEIEYANERALGLFGYSQKEICAKKMKDLTAGAEHAPTAIGDQLFLKRNAVIERSLEKKGGSSFFAEITSGTFYDSDGKKKCIASVRDVTERKKWEREVDRSERFGKGLNALLKVSMENISLQEQLQRALDILLSTPNLEILSKGCIYLASDGRLEMIVQRGLSYELVSRCREIPIGKCLCGMAAKTGRLQACEHIDDRHEIVFEGMADHGHCNMPILAGGEVLGVINLYLPAGHQIQPFEKDFLMAAADTLGGIIIRKRAEEEIKQTSQLHKALNEVLKISLQENTMEEFLQQVLMVIFDLPFTRLSDRGAIFISEGGVLKLRGQRNLSPSLLSLCAEVPYGRCLCGRAAESCEIQFSESVDERHDVRPHGMGEHGHYAVPIVSKGKTLGVFNVYLEQGHKKRQEEVRFLSAIADTLAGIIERKNTESLLKDSESRFRAFTDSSPDAIVSADSEGKVIFWNKAAEKIFGHKKSDITGDSIESILTETPGGGGAPADFGKGFRFQDHSEIIGRTVEILARNKDGLHFPIEMSLSTWESGKESFYGAIIRDITERQRTEKALEHRNREVEERARHIKCLYNISRLMEKDDSSVETIAQGIAFLLPMGLRNPGNSHCRILLNGRAFCSEGIREGKRKVKADIKRNGQVVGMVEVFNGSSPTPGEEPFTNEEMDLIHEIAERLDRAIEYFESDSERRRLEKVVDQAAETIVITDVDGNIQYVNPMFERTSGYSKGEAVGQNPRILKSGEHDANFYEKMWKTLTAGKVWKGEFINRRKDGGIYRERGTITPIFDKRGQIVNFAAIKRDITQEAVMESQLRQAQKLESIGQLAAGIAHEINTPMQFIGDNMRFLEESISSVTEVVEKYAALCAAAAEKGFEPELTAEIKDMASDAELDYLMEEIPTAVVQSLEGVDRVSKIVRAMKEFAHPGVTDKRPADLNKAVENTAVVSRNEWKYVADLKMDLDPNLPLVLCMEGEFNQVILNLIVNASHAIEMKTGKDGGRKGLITISTRREGDWAEIRVRDTGCGIPSEIREKIYDPFFTTKEIGKGTGQGLAIARSVIVEKHGGQLDCESSDGEGTTMVIRLPLSEIAQEEA